MTGKDRRILMGEKFETGKVNGEEIDVVEMAAPAGWKKFAPSHVTLKRNEVLFISPSGEEIRNREQLKLFLRSHPGGPSRSEFDWTYGANLRRSARLSEKMKATESSEETPRKKHKSYTNNGTEEQEEGGDSEEEVEVEVHESEKDAQADSIVDADMKDVEDNSSKEKDELSNKTIEEGEEAKGKVVDERQDAENKNEHENVNATESLEESPREKHKIDANNGTDEQEKGGDSEEEIADEVHESEKKDAQVDTIVDADMKDVEDGSSKERGELSSKTIEEGEEVKGNVVDERQDAENKNEHEKVPLADLNEDAPVVSPPAETGEENSAACENQEKLEMEEASRVMPAVSALTETAPCESHEKLEAEEVSRDAHFLSAPDVTEKENSAEENFKTKEVANDGPIVLSPKAAKDENLDIYENHQSVEMEDGSQNAPFLFSPQVTSKEDEASGQNHENFEKEVTREAAGKENATAHQNHENLFE